jgi:hypothetical protein
VIDGEARGHVGAVGAIHEIAAAQCLGCERGVDLCRLLRKLGSD